MMLKAQCPYCGGILEAELNVNSEHADYVVGPHTAHDTALDVANPVRYHVGDLLFAPRTEERMLVLVAPGTTPITVRRGILKTRPAPLLDNDRLEVE